MLTAVRAADKALAQAAGAQLLVGPLALPPHHARPPAQRAPARQPKRCLMPLESKEGQTLILIRNLSAEPGPVEGTQLGGKPAAATGTALGAQPGQAPSARLQLGAQPVMYTHAAAIMLGI